MITGWNCLSHGVLVFALCQASREVRLVYETRMSCEACKDLDRRKELVFGRIRPST